MKGYRNSSIREQEGIYYLRIKEDNYYDVGHTYGKMLVNVEHPVLNFLRNWFVVYILSILMKLFSKRINEINIPKDYLNEIRGYADATEISYDILMFLNFYFDVSGKSGLSGSTFTFFNDKGLFVGNNTDVKSLIMRILLRHTKSIVVEMNILGRNKFTYVSFPFFVGVVNGFNENIILSSHKILRKDNKFVNGRLGIFILSRYLLENSKDISEIRNIIPKNLPGKSMNLMVTDIGRKKSSVFEISSGGVNELTIKGQWMGCTNHIKSEKMRDLYAGLPEASEVVLKSLETLLSEVEEMTVDKSVSILQNKGSGLKGRFGNSSVANNATCQSFVFDFENMEMHISNSNKRPVSLNGKFVKISF